MLDKNGWVGFKAQWTVLLMLCLFLLGLAQHTKAAPVSATWVGGTGNWNVASNWSPAVVPNNGTPAGTTYSVFIDGGAGGASNVSLNTNATIDMLTISSGDTLGINNGQSLTIATASTLSNAGTITLNSTGSSTDLRINADLSLTGGGVVTLSNNTTNRVFGTSTGTERLTNVNNTISGAGQIGVNFMRLTNNSTGLILANASAGLTIDPNATSNVNLGTMRADGGNTLSFNGGAIDNTSGTIRANASMVVMNGSAAITAGTVDVIGAGELRLVNGASVTGGTLTNSSTGIIRSQNSTNTIGGAVSNPAGGQIILDNGTTLVLTGGGGNSYSNAGSIALNSTGSSTDLRINADLSLTGGGVVTLSNNTTNRVFGTSTGTERLTNVNNTISGAGQIGVNFMRLTNNSTGLILANASAGLTIDPNATSNVNLGTMRADGGNTLSFNGGAIDNTSGTIRANASMVVMNGSAAITAGTVDVIGAGELRLVNGASVTGGTLTNSSTGIIRSQNSTNTIGGAVSNPAGGQIILDNGTTLVLTGGGGNSYSNAGSIALNSTGSSTDLRINADLSLTGGGVVTLSNNTTNRVFGTSTGTERLTNVNNTISGAGQIGVNFMRLTNNSTGLILANASAGLTIDPNATSNVNLGTMRADGGNTLSFNGGAIDNTSGTIRANVGTVIMNGGAVITAGAVDVIGAGELRLVNGASVTGGTLTNSSTGIIRSQNSTNTIGGAVSNPASGQIILDNGTTLVVTGGVGNSYSNAGSIALNSTGSSTDLRISGDVSLDGGGTVVMSNNTNNRIFGNSSGAEMLTNVNNTISGAGQIGVNFMKFTNQGTVRADQVADLLIDVTPSATGFTTSGIVQANAGSILKMASGDIFTQTAGSTIVNGTLGLLGPTTMALSGGTLNGSGTVNGLVNNTGGTVAPGNSPGLLSEIGNYTQASGGAFNVELNGTTVGTGYDQLNVTGTVTLNGSLNVTVGGGLVAAHNAVFVIINNDGADAVTGTFTSLPEGSTIVAGGRTFQISYVGGDGNDVTLKHLLQASISDVTVTEGDAGSVTATFTVSLSGASSEAVTVDFATADGTGKAPDDYTAANGTVTFAAGETSKPVNVTVLGDTLDENNETFFVNLTNPTKTLIADTQGKGTITDNDPLPVLSINDVTITEGDSGTTNAVFTISLSSASGKTVTVKYATADGTATAPADYTALPLTTLTFSSGQTSKTVTVAVKGDLLNESNETFFVNLSAPTNATIADSQGLGTITDNDALAVLSINDVTITEGNSGTTNATFTVTLSPVSGRTVTVNFATANGTASAPADYTASSGTVTFNPGDTSKTITVPIVGDTLDENNETFFVNLTNPVSSTIGDAQGKGTITDNDALPVLSINDVTITEGDSGTTNAVFTISLSSASGKTVTVKYATADGTATAPADYTALPLTTLTFSSGQTSKTVTVAVKGDLLNESNETFFVNLSAPTNATIADSQGLGTITDNDALAVFSINDVTITEGNSGTTNATFTVTLSPVSGRTVTVDYATSNGTTNPALAGTDYTTTSGTLTFNAGVTTQTVSVPIIGDTLDENNETFFVNLTNPVSSTIGDAQGKGTITDNDALPVLSINDVTITEGDSGTTNAVFTISLSSASGKTVTVKYATADGTATAPADYTALPLTTLTFSSGQTSKTVTVAVKGDLLNESNETFFVNLSAPTNATIADSQGLGTITNDDAS